jgi:hypothetical protein
MIYSGAPHDKKPREAHGVAICPDQTSTIVWRGSGSEWKPISERIIKTRFLCVLIHITVLAVYSSIKLLRKRMGNESDKFYADV